MKKKQNKKTVTFFDKDTGEIFSVGSADLNNLKLLDNLDYIIGRVDDVKYNINIETKEPILKKELPILIEDNRITNIPIGTKLKVFGQLREPKDGILEIEVDFDEEVTVFIINNMYLRKESVVVPCKSNFISIRSDKVIRKPDPIRMRQSSHLSTGDQLDGILKILKVLLEDVSPSTLAKIPSDALSILDNWQNVKNKFPKKNP